MTIMTKASLSVTEFKAHCLEVLRRVESSGVSVDLVRHGKVVACLVPTAPGAAATPAWLRLRGQGRLLAAPDESSLTEDDFEAMR